MYIKKSLIRILCSVVLGLAFGIFLIWVFDGPRLGFFYDFLMGRRKAPQVFPALVLIDSSAVSMSNNVVDPAVIASALMCLAEAGADQVVIQAPVLGISSGSAGKDREIILQVKNEFERVGENVRKLFQGIQTGSISPAESDLYVGELITLINRSKDRLVDAVSEEESAGLHFFEKATRIKGKVWLRDDALIPEYPPEAEGKKAEVPGGMQFYINYQPDADGVFRRIAPLVRHDNGKELHYLIFDAVRDRLVPLMIQYTDLGIVFSGMKGRGFENRDLILPLDKNGALILDKPGGELPFRRIPLDLFLEYEEADRALYKLLSEMERLGYYDQLEPEKHPTALYRYSQAMREDLLRDAGNEKAKQLWLESRDAYIDGLNHFFTGGVETALVAGYEELIASEEMDEVVKQHLVSMRDLLIQNFASCREAYENFCGMRDDMILQLQDSFCIVGPLGTGHPSWGRGIAVNPGETEASANFANAIFTGNAVKPAENIQLGFWVFIWVFISSFFIRKTGALPTILLGIAAAFLCIVFFSSLFVYRALWINPFIPAGAVLFGTLASLSAGLIMKRRLNRELHRAYSPFISLPILKKIIRQAEPEPWETIVAYSVIIAVRNHAVMTSESKDSPVIAALAVREFREEVSRLFKNAGAAVIGSDGDLVLAALASPLERIALRNAVPSAQYMDRAGDAGKVNPVDRAVSLIKDVMKQKAAAGQWRFGMDCGECAFTYSDASGYSAFGYPVVKARILSGLSGKYDARVLISSQMKEHAGLTLETRKLDTLVERELGTEESFYALLIKENF